MQVDVPTLRQPTRLRSTLPPVGPPWFGSVMGTAILASLVQSYGAPWWPALAGARSLLAIAWILLGLLTVGFVRRCQRDSGLLASAARDAEIAPGWGMVSMALLAVGSATTTIVPPWLPSLTALAWEIDTACWIVGTALGLVTALGFAVFLRRHAAGAPRFAWGLPLVPPMVSATTGAALAEHVGAPWRTPVLLVATLCFVVALLLGGAAFARCYHHHWRVERVPAVATPSTWIPLGVVGQSTAAAQALTGAAAEPGSPIVAVAHAYGVGMLLLGVPLLAWAVAVTGRAFADGLPYTPGWWAMTFPLGTVSMGAHLLGTSAGWELMDVVGATVCGALVGTWSLCAAATLRAVIWGREMSPQK